MRVLIGNLVKTDVADYPCSSREEAEALYLALRRPHPAGSEPEWSPKTVSESGEAPVRRNERSSRS